jgi:hypothetical protein
LKAIVLRKINRDASKAQANHSFFVRPLPTDLIRG